MPLDIDDFPELAAARSLWQSGRVIKANEAYASAVNSKPKNVRAKVEFAKALGQQHQIIAAEKLLRQAESISDGHAKALIVVAQAFRSVYRQEHALSIFEHLHRQSQLPAAILGELAVLYEQFGRYDHALEVIEQCLALASDRPEPKLIHARLLRHLKRLDTAENILQGLSALPNASPALQVEAFTELCHLHDTRGEYDAAVKSIEKAKSILRGTATVQKLKQQSMRLNQRFAKLYEELDEQAIHRWLDTRLESHSHANGVAHILGFPRTGTTLLEQALDGHPNVSCAPERVVFSKHIFPGFSKPNQDIATLETIDGASDTKLASLSNEYFRCHAEIRGQTYEDQWLVDKNPNHTSLVAGILRVLPSSKFVTVQRDPRDVIVSCYLRNFPLSEYSVAFLDVQSAWELYGHEQQILERMKRLIGDRFIEVRYDDMVEDLGREANRVFEFLGVEKNAASADHQSTTQAKIVNSPSHAEVRRPVDSSRIGRWMNYRDCLEGIEDGFKRISKP